MSAEAVRHGKPRYVLDTSALLTLSGDEPGADTVSMVLMKARRREVHAYLSFISITEAGYRPIRLAGKTVWCRFWPIASSFLSSG